MQNIWLWRPTRGHIEGWHSSAACSHSRTAPLLAQSGGHSLQCPLWEIWRLWHKQKLQDKGAELNVMTQNYEEEKKSRGLLFAFCADAASYRQTKGKATLAQAKDHENESV